MRHGEISADLAARLLVLQERIEEAKIPASKLDESFNLATWNIRDFGSDKRSDDATHMIAEVLYQFDLIAINELGADLRPMKRVMDILGPYWRLVYNDVAPGYSGNSERTGFLYDKRMVEFTGFAAEATPKASRPAAGEDYAPETWWWRAPYMASFRAGTFDFVLMSFHAQWGTDEGRAAELQSLADWLEKWRKRDADRIVDKDIVVMGDFNIAKAKKSDPHFKALTSGGLRMPKALAGVEDTMVTSASSYDQILHYPYFNKSFSNKGGVLDFYRGDHRPLFPDLSRDDFTYQMSDHMPLWIQVKTDVEEERLDQIINP